MYSNIGNKIKTLAVVIACLGVILSVCYGMYLIITQDNPYPGIKLLVKGSLYSWISSWILYGFGEIIVKVTEIAENTSENTYATGDQNNNKQCLIVCSSCGNIMQLEAGHQKPIACTHCGKIIKY